MNQLEDSISRSNQLKEILAHIQDQQPMVPTPWSIVSTSWWTMTQLIQIMYLDSIDWCNVTCITWWSSCHRIRPGHFPVCNNMPGYGGKCRRWTGIGNIWRRNSSKLSWNDTSYLKLTLRESDQWIVVSTVLFIELHQLICNRPSFEMGAITVIGIIQYSIFSEKQVYRYSFFGGFQARVWMDIGLCYWQEALLLIIY